MPEVRGLSVKEAITILQEAGLDVKLDEEKTNRDELKVKEQIPKPGLSIYAGSKIELIT